MANKEKGESAYLVGGKEYILLLDSDAMVLMEAAASTPEQRVVYGQIMKWAQEGSWTHQRILVWAALRAHHPEITLKQAGDLMLQSAQEEMVQALKNLAVSATPDPEDLKELGIDPERPPAAQGKTRGRKPRTPPGTGAPSSSTLAVSA